ncbi:MAG: hypothetical protein EOO17_01020 [Chloroflexi bacterium]|nr:MAG: hypothetical protein EOO17_01020 [Chloroflexota bacterium]
MGRVQSVVARANKRLTIQLAAALLAGSTLISLLFGFFRMRLLNGTYYDTYKTGYDAYIAAFIGLLGLGFDYRFKIYWKNKGFRKVLSLLPARSLDQGMDFLVGIVETNLASRFAMGTLAAYNQATTLHMAPINMIGVVISTAAFPKMTERLSQGRPDLFKSELQTVLRVIVWLAMPVAVVTYFTRGYLVNFIKNGGDALMAGLLGALVVAILFRSIYYIAARSFYAQQDTKTPLYISIFAISLNIGLAIWFSLELGMGAYGLAYAQSIVAVVEVLILFVVMSRRIKGLFDAKLFNAFTKMAIASTITIWINLTFETFVLLRTSTTESRHLLTA